MMNIGFISTRFCGTDGVTLEASKWAQVFERNGYPCFWFAGELDRDPSASYLAPEAHFTYETNAQINDAVIALVDPRPGGSPWTGRKNFGFVKRIISFCSSMLA